MSIAELFMNSVLVLLCYLYILTIIVISRRMHTNLNVSQKTARKFLHAMIGNLTLIIPFFTITMFPVLVAAPFMAITFLATSYSPLKSLNRRLKILSDLTEEGHQLGLFFYAISYTCLALLFSSKAHIIAAGILPMTYGDAAASVIGEKCGRHRYKLVAQKSFEGSAAMFLTSLASLTLSLLFFSTVYGFQFLNKLIAVASTATIATFVEGFSPLGFDNLAVPAFGTLTFLLYGGGI